MPNTFIHPENILPDVVHGYTSVVVSTGNKMVHCAGQVSMDAELNIVGDNLAEQMAQCFKALGIALAAGGATPADVVRGRIYIVDYNVEMVPTVIEQTAAFYGPGEPPPSTLLGVQSLALPGLMVEIEATAVLDY
jgi:enamine deaminase RidA (YjgF/YER057c/UK114 family)